jgi:hypothetical protein
MSKDLCIEVFNEDNPKQHLMKVGVILGTFLGFQGGKEHADLVTEHLQVGTFEVGHELEGTEYYGLTPKEDSATKLTTTNPVLQKSEYTHIPIGNKTHPSSPGGTIWRYLQKIGPGQKCIYYKVASESERLKFGQTGYPQATYSPHCPLVINTISRFLGEAANMLGCGDVKGHGF